MRSATGLNRSLYGATTMRGSGSAIGLVGGAMCIHGRGVDNNLFEKARELGEKYRLYRNIKANMRGGAMSGGMYGEGKKAPEKKEKKKTLITELTEKSLEYIDNKTPGLLDQPPPERAPLNTTFSKEYKKGGEHKRLVDLWEDPYLGNIIDSFSTLSDNITKFIEQKNNKNYGVVDAGFDFFLKDYSNDIIEKYGVDSFLEGLKKIADHYGTNNYVQTFGTSYETQVGKYVSRHNKNLINLRCMEIFSSIGAQLKERVEKQRDYFHVTEKKAPEKKEKKAPEKKALAEKKKNSKIAPTYNEKFIRDHKLGDQKYTGEMMKELRDKYSGTTKNTDHLNKYVSLEKMGRLESFYMDFYNFVISTYSPELQDTKEIKEYADALTMNEIDNALKMSKWAEPKKNTFQKILSESIMKEKAPEKKEKKAPDPDVRAVVPEDPEIRRPAVHEEPEAPNIFINENPKYEKDEPDPASQKKQMRAMKKKEREDKERQEAKIRAERQAIIDKEDEEEARAFHAKLARAEKLKMEESALKKEMADRWTESDEDYLKRMEKKERTYKIREKKEEKAPEKAPEKKAEKAPEKKVEKKAEKAPEKKAEKKIEKLENKIEELKEVIVELKEDKKEMAGSPSKKIKCRICGVVFDNYHLMSPVHLEALAKRKAERLRLKEEDKKNNPEKYERIARERKQRANAWITHLKAYREANPDVSYKVAMQRAKATYNR